MKLLVSVLEPSANIHLGALCQELSEDVELMGVFDKRLGNPVVDLNEVAVMGFVDALKKLSFFKELSKKMLDLAAEADKVLLMDSSGFNLPLAKKIRKRYPQKEIIYYILPQAWAWRQSRIPVLEKTITHLCSILPFEQEYYSDNAPISYVGHPLLDEICDYKQELGDNGIVSFLPGSRKGEIEKLMPVFRELVKKLDKKAYVVIPQHFSKEFIDEVYGDLSDFTIRTDSHKALYESDFAFVCSGTATLEAALIGVPFILAYRAKKLDYLIAKTFVKLNYIGLGNIMFDKFLSRPLYKELIQDDVTVENLFKAYEETNREKFLEDAKSLRGYLGHGSSLNVAKLIEGKE